MCAKLIFKTSNWLQRGEKVDSNWDVGEVMNRIRQRPIRSGNIKNKCNYCSPLSNNSINTLSTKLSYSNLINQSNKVTVHAEYGNDLLRFYLLTYYLVTSVLSHLKIKTQFNDPSISNVHRKLYTPA